MLRYYKVHSTTMGEEVCVVILFFFNNKSFPSNSHKTHSELLNWTSLVYIEKYTKLNSYLIKVQKNWKNLQIEIR